MATKKPAKPTKPTKKAAKPTKPTKKAAKPTKKSAKPAKAKPRPKKSAKPGKQDLAALAAATLGQRVDHWLSEGSIGATPVSYTIEDGVLTYRRDGMPSPISPKNERLIARKFCKPHLAYLVGLEACRAAIAGGAKLDAATLQALADLAHPWTAEAVSARGAKLPPARRLAGDPIKLHVAVHDGDLPALRAQLARGVEVDARNHQGYTVLLAAARGAFLDCVQALLAAGADVNATLPPGGFNCLHLVIEHTENRPIDFTVTLTRNGKKVTLTDRDEIRAATGGHPDDEYDACVAIARALVTAGIEVDHPTSANQTPLSHAASRGTLEITELLLATKRVALDSRDADGVSPLHYGSRHGHVDCVKALLRAGAQADIAENYGFTPLHEAAENGHEAVARALLDAGADRTRGLLKAFGKFPAGATPADVAKLAGRKALVSMLA